MVGRICRRSPRGVKERIVDRLADEIRRSPQKAVHDGWIGVDDQLAETVEHVSRASRRDLLRGEKFRDCCQLDVGADYDPSVVAMRLRHSQRERPGGCGQIRPDGDDAGHGRGHLVPGPASWIVVGLDGIGRGKNAFALADKLPVRRELAVGVLGNDAYREAGGVGSAHGRTPGGVVGKVDGMQKGAIGIAGIEAVYIGRALQGLHKRQPLALQRGRRSSCKALRHGRHRDERLDIVEDDSIAVDGSLGQKLHALNGGGHGDIAPAVVGKPEQRHGSADEQQKDQHAQMDVERDRPPSRRRGSGHAAIRKAVVRGSIRSCGSLPGVVSRRQSEKPLYPGRGSKGRQSWRRANFPLCSPPQREARSRPNRHFGTGGNPLPHRSPGGFHRATASFAS